MMMSTQHDARQFAGMEQARPYQSQVQDAGVPTRAPTVNGALAESQDNEARLRDLLARASSIGDVLRGQRPAPTSEKNGVSSLSFGLTGALEDSIRGVHSLILALDNELSRIADAVAG